MLKTGQVSYYKVWAIFITKWGCKIKNSGEYEANCGRE